MRIPTLLAVHRSHFHSTSELTNGIKVVTVRSPAEFDAAGVVLQYSKLPRLLQHKVLAYDKAVFKGHALLPEADLLRRLDGIIGSSHGRVGRECMVVGGAVSPLHMPDLLSLLKDLLSAPPLPISKKELDQAVEYDLLEWRTKQPNQLLPELAIAAGYPTLGTSIVDYCLHNTDAQEGESVALEDFWRSACCPNRLTLVGLSSHTTHADFMELANRLYIDWPLRTAAKEEDELDGRHDFKPTVAAEDVVTLLDTEMPLTHVAIGFPGLALGDPNAVTLKVLERLLGGGGSFSAGGPGKGMYARLYTSVLNRYYWMESARCFSRSFSATGVFGIHGSAPPGYVRDLVKVLTGALHDAAQHCISPEELDRAKAQVKSASFMDAEGRLGQLESVAEQIAGNGRVLLPDDFGAAVDAVSDEDVRSLARRLVAKAKPVVVAYGSNVDKLPPLV